MVSLFNGECGSLRSGPRHRGGHRGVGTTRDSSSADLSRLPGTGAHRGECAGRRYDPVGGSGPPDTRAPRGANRPGPSEALYRMQDAGYDFTGNAERVPAGIEFDVLVTDAQLQGLDDLALRAGEGSAQP